MYNPQNPTVFVVTGNPNGQLAGNASGAIHPGTPPDVAWDGQNLWFCTTTGPANSAAWSRMSGTNIANIPNNLGTVSNGTVTLDRNTGVVQVLAVGGPLTIAIINFIPGYSEILLELINGGSSTITWPANINWITSTGAVTTSFASYGAQLQAAGTDFVAFWSPDGGTTIYGKVVR